MTARPKSRICITCGNRFSPRQRGGKPQIHCSQRCRTVSKTSAQSPAKPGRSKVCKRLGCRRKFSPRTAQRYCSVDCRIRDRRCPKCGQPLMQSQPGTKSTYCRTCQNEYARLRRLLPGRRSAGVATQRKRIFGLSADEYQGLVVAQNNRCAICKRPETSTRGGKLRTLCVDHNHKTRVIRGLLCSKCNSALGLLKDSRLILDSAVKYLGRPTRAQTQPMSESVATESHKTTLVSRNTEKTKTQFKSCTRPDCSRQFPRRTSKRYCSVKCRKLDKKCFSCRESMPMNQQVAKSRLCVTCISKRNSQKSVFLSVNIKNYSLSIGEYQVMFNAQSGNCAVCKRPEVVSGASGLKPLAIDHSHQNGSVRGLLCTACNTAIGLFNEEIKLFKAASEYLGTANTGRKIPQDKPQRKCGRSGCPELVPKASNGKFCSDVCRISVYEATARRDHKAKKCLVCREVFEPNSAAAQFCSNLCRARYRP